MSKYEGWTQTEVRVFKRMRRAMFWRCIVNPFRKLRSAEELLAEFYECVRKEEAR